MAAVHRKLGLATRTTNKNWSMRRFNLQTSVMLVQQTQFEHGAATETFTFVVRGESATLLGYNIQSVDLITL